MQATLRVPISPQPSTTFSTLRPKREVICSRSYGWGGGGCSPRTGIQSLSLSPCFLEEGSEALSPKGSGRERYGERKVVGNEEGSSH